MKLSRDVTSRIRFVLDEILPPVVRDSRFFMALPFKLLYKDKADIFMNFKQKASQLSKPEFANIYKKISEMDNRDTDLNSACEKKIINKIIGRSILEVGCGKGYLVKKLSENYKVSACDVAINKTYFKKYPDIRIRNANIEKLPYKNRAFDTVVCTHTIEHVQDIFSAIKELRRVTKKRLIIVVPKQRPYRYTFDLHLHFFPYEHSLRTIMQLGKYQSSTCKTIGGDLFYIENY